MTTLPAGCSSPQTPAARGLNLQHASTLVNMDLPWNPAVLEQRIARIHRMGQTQPVRIINFVAKGTIEEGMLSVLAFKRSLSAGILDGGIGEISLGGSRLNRFMNEVENVTGQIGESEPCNVGRGDRGQHRSCRLCRTRREHEGGCGHWYRRYRALERARSATERSRHRIRGMPWRRWVRSSLPLSRPPTIPRRPAHPWIECDPATGVRSLKMPLPPPETATTDSPMHFRRSRTGYEAGVLDGLFAGL